jgi:hypothetical protein
MKRWTSVLVITIGCVLFASGSAFGYNALWIESKTVPAGTTGVTVGVWVVNDSNLTGFVLPLEFRDTDGNGSYIAGPAGSCTFNIPAGNRIGASPLTGSATKRILGEPVAQTCSGPVSNSYTTNKAVDFVSPDGFVWMGVSTNGSPDLYYLPAGSDSVAGTHVGWPVDGESTVYSAGASFNFVFNVNATAGTFEIDTCCVTPANHLEGTALDANNRVFFDVHPGVITITGSDVRSLGTGGNVPTTYALEQNYPNPFNASTVVRFSIPHDGRVRLEVFDVLGRKVRTLVDDVKPLGLYAVDWDGTDNSGTPVSTGVYFYRIQTADYSKTRSMLLLK